MTTDDAVRRHFIKAAIRAKVAQLCGEAAKRDARFSEAAKYWAAASIYELALAFKTLAEARSQSDDVRREV